MSGLPEPGALVVWWAGNDLGFAVLVGEQGGRVRLVREGGRELRVPAARLAFAVEPRGPVPGPTPEERQAAGARAAACAERVREQAAECDVALLWEIAAEQPAPYPVDALAELAFGEAAGPQRAALVRALLDDGVRFVRKAEDWEPRPAEQVEQLLEQRRRTAARAADKRRFLEALADAVGGAGFTRTDGEQERKYLAALRDVAFEGQEAPEHARKLAAEALEASGLPHDRPREGAFRLLRRLGEFESDDENLDLLRYRIRREFPAQVLEHAARAAARPPAEDGRRDLTAVETVTIDSPETREVDDGLSLELLPDGGARIGIHIADPAAFVRPGDPVDAEALARGISHYLPDRKLPMIPPAVSETAASLVPGEPRPALSFLVALDASGEVAAWEIVRSMVLSRSRLSYDEIDVAVAGRRGGPEDPPWLRLLGPLLARERFRTARGAVRIPADEVEPYVDADGTVGLRRHPGDSPSRRAVGEAMVLAGTVAARFCSERGLPAIYRRQPRPERPPELPPDGEWDPVTLRAVRRSMRRGEVGLQPGEHYALGLPAYAQVTSPLRRFQDLATHRQIGAVLAGQAPPYDDATLQRIAATTEQSEFLARRIERAADRYWLLRCLEQRGSATVEAVVVAVAPRPVVELCETLLEQTVPSLGGVEPGRRIELRIERINPRADLLVLRP